MRFSCVGKRITVQSIEVARSQHAQCSRFPGQVRSRHRHKCNLFDTVGCLTGRTLRFRSRLRCSAGSHRCVEAIEPSEISSLPHYAMPPQDPNQSQWFTQDVQVHEPALRAYLRGNFPTLLDADDIVQESYVRVIRAKASGNLTHTKAYLFATARNAVRDLFRRRQVVTMEPMANIEDLQVAHDSVGAPATLNKKQELAILAEAIRSLPDRCREILSLRLIEELPQKEIAAKLGLTEFAVKAQIAKGVVHCTKYFEARGIITPMIGARTPTR